MKKVASLASEHGAAPAKPGPSAALGSLNASIARLLVGNLKRQKSAVAGGQSKAPLKSNSRKRKRTGA